MARRLPPRAGEKKATRSKKNRTTSAAALASAVAYARVSSKEQEKEGYSIPAQQELLRRYAADRGLRIVEEFIDVETAKRTGRASFGKMLTYLRKHRSCKVVLVEKTDRLYRNLKDWVTLDEVGLEIHLVKEGVVLSDESRSTDKFMHGIRVLMAKNYIDNLTEEVQKGMRQKAEEGYWPSAAPVGYLNQRTAGRSYLVVDPEKGPLVRQLIELYDSGEHTVTDLVAWCERVGLVGKHGRPLNHTTIHGILRNPIFAGRFIWGGRLYDGKDPTLVSWETWERVQERMDGIAYHRETTHDFAFTGLITCGYCGGAVTAEIKKKKYIYYHCSKKCRREPFVREERLAELLGEVMRPVQMPVELADVAIDGLKSARKMIKVESERRLAALRSRYDRIGRLIDRAYAEKLEGRIDQAFFERNRAAWDGERWEIQREVDRLAAADGESLDLGIQVLELAKKAHELFVRQSPANQAEMLRIVLSNCSLAGGELTPIYRNPFDLIVDLTRGAGNENAGPDGSGPANVLLVERKGIEPSTS